MDVDLLPLEMKMFSIHVVNKGNASILHKLYFIKRCNCNQFSNSPLEMEDWCNYFEINLEFIIPMIFLLFENKQPIWDL